jgi:hypothetical protein
MAGELRRTRWPGTCACGTAVHSGSHAWDPIGRRVVCASCAVIEIPVQIGTPGASALRQYERRRQRREQEVLAEHPHLGRLLLKVLDEPPTTKAWATGAAGERRIAERLAEVAGPDVLFLHDRRIPRSRANIDHIAIAPSGVFVIDAKHYDDAKVAVRRTGGILRPATEQLLVRGRDCTNQVAKLAPQVSAVSDALSRHPQYASVRVQPMLCFLGVYGLGKPLSIAGVTVAGPTSTGELVCAEGPLTEHERWHLQQILGTHLRSAT